MKAHKNPWKTLKTELKYDNPWIRVTESQVINPSGNAGIYGKVHFKNIAVGIIPLDKELNTWIVGQYRYVLEDYSWEIPEGGGRLDMEAIESAKRELKEETGITANHWTKIIDLHLSNSVSDEVGVVYLARDLNFGSAEPEDSEDLVIKKLPFKELFEMTMKGEITDGLAVAAILKTQLLLESGEL